MLPGFAFSAGLAQGQSGESVWEPARRADLALYAAKRAGKGRVLGDGVSFPQTFAPEEKPIL